MARRILARLLHRLDRSPLPPCDPVRIELERELLDLMTPTILTRARPFVVLVHDDARGEADTAVPN